MNPDDNNQEISSSNYIGESHLVKNIDCPLTEASLLIPCDQDNNSIASSRLCTSNVNYETGFQKAICTYLHPQNEVQREDYLSLNHERLKKQCNNDAIEYINHASFYNKMQDAPQYSNKKEYSKMKKIGDSQQIGLPRESFPYRMAPTLWQSAMRHDKSFVSLNHIDGIDGCTGSGFNANSSIKTMNSNINVTDSLIDTRSPMLNDFHNQNSNLLIENCLVSSSTGNIDSITIPSIVGEPANFLYNANLLDSAVDSTTGGIITSCSGDNSEDEFHSNCGSVESAAKYDDGQIYQNDKYFIFDPIQNDIRLSQVEPCSSDRGNLLGVPGPSGVSKYSRTPQKLVKISEKSPQDKNLYCLQNFPFDVENCGLTLAVRDSVSSTELNEIGEGYRKSTSINANKLPNEFYSDKRISANQDSIIFEDESFPASDYTGNVDSLRENSREYFDSSTQHFIRDELTLRSIESSMMNKAQLRLNQQEPPYIGTIQCYDVEDIDMNSAKDMTTIKRISANDSKSSSDVLNICELSAAEVVEDLSDSNFIPEDLSSPLKFKDKYCEGPTEKAYVNISKNNPPNNTKTKSHSVNSSYKQFEPNSENNVDVGLTNSRGKALFGPNLKLKGNYSDCNSPRNKKTIESLPIHKLKKSAKSKRGPKLLSVGFTDDSKSSVELENVKESAFWCDECDKYLASKCNIHTVRTIIDKPVHSRPLASIPTQYLSIKVINKEEQLHGVFTRKTIPRRVKFGPVEGAFMEGEPPFSNRFFVTRNAVRGYLETSDDRKSNWMKLVRWAESFTEMNCVAVEEDSEVYFLTTVDIPAKKELKVGYSKQYSMKYGLQYLKPSEEELAALEHKEKLNCFECDEKFKSSFLLEEHLALHDKDGPRKKKRRKGKIKLNDSYRKSPKEGNTKSESSKKRKDSLEECEICLLCFAKTDLLLLHRELHVSEKSNRIEYKDDQVDNSCPECHQMFKTRNDLSHHVNSHSIKKNDTPIKKLYKCNLCYKSFENEAKLSSHAIVHVVKPNGDFPCQLCHRRFPSVQTLTSHQKFHKDTFEYCCPMCNQKFDSLSQMRLHIPEHHINGVYTCPYCQKTFPVYHKIRRHIRNYHPETVHPCPQCGKTLSSIDKLRIHLLSHSDRRDFICDVCNRGFKRKDKLKEHQKRGHANIRSTMLTKREEKASKKDIETFKYKCEKCIRGFKRRGMLVNHLSKRHPNIPLDSVPQLTQPILKECRIFFCHYCNKSYETSSKRKVHILKHHPGAAIVPADAKESSGNPCNTVVLTPKKAFAVSCAFCPRQYATNAKLLQHHRKHHKQEKSRKSKPKSARVEQKTSEVFMATSIEDESLNNAQLIKLTHLNPNLQLQLKDNNRFGDGEVYVNVPTTQPILLEGDFSDEQTLTVLASNADDSFCVALRPGHILSNIGVICHSDLPYVATSSKSGSFVSDDTFQEEQINFTTDTAKGECILTQVDANSPLLLWQPGVFSNVN